MTLENIIQITSQIVGLFAALLFCRGGLQVTDKSINKIAFSMWNKGYEIALGMIQQKYDFIGGAILLIISFSFQLVTLTFSEKLSSINIGLKSSGILISLSFSLIIVIFVYTLALHHRKESIMKLKLSKET